jgi:PUA-domain protein
MKRKQLSNKELRELNEGIGASFGVNDFFSKKDSVELQEDEFIMRNGKLVFFYVGKQMVPSLKLLQENNFLPTVVVDMPAVKFMVNGADVMRPGIVEMGVFDEGQLVVIVDENNKKPLAIGEALFDSNEMKEMDSGKVVKMIHYVGDKVWSRE